jgi:hypothetical protein
MRRGAMAKVFVTFSICILFIVACKTENISLINQMAEHKQMDAIAKADNNNEIEGEDTAVVEIFKNLEGMWQIQREIGGYGNMEGTASFQKIRNDSKSYYYYYKEEGVLYLLTGTQCRVYKEYTYSYKKGEISVHFWDNRRRQQGALMHTLSFPDAQKKGCWPLQAHGTHQCNQDTYKAYYMFTDNSNFRLSYNVWGPHKNYIIKTNFCRAIQRIK